MRKKIIAGNWKMNNDAVTSSEFINNMNAWFALPEGKRAVRAIEAGEVELVVAPPFTSIGAAASARKNAEWISIAAQNAFYEPKGAYTGEISLSMLWEAGCKYVILGHSERRHIFGESLELLQKKLLAALETQILPIFCVGELLEERESGAMEKVLQKQLEGAWDALTSDVLADMVVIAYEPVWAIGTGRTAENEDADDACAYIRSLVDDKFGPAAAEKVKILYGGSVKPENSAGILAQPNIDGLLIGGASLNSESFCAIVASAL